MDDAARRVDLRGLRLLERCRALRRDKAARALAERAAAVEAAEVAERAASEDLADHRAAWLAREDAVMADSVGAAVAGQRFRAALSELDRMADGTVQRQAGLAAAGAAIEDAKAAAEAARVALAAQQRRLQQSEAMGARVRGLRETAAEAEAEQELDDDMAVRHRGAGGAR